jgi:hypothetical protein
MEATKLASGVIIALPPANVDLLVQKIPIFSMCTQIKNCGYIRPNTVFGKTGYMENHGCFKVHSC